MNNIPENPPAKKSWAVWLLPAVILVVAASVMLQRSGGGTPQSVTEFDPAAFSELQIKGTRPDGASSWFTIPVPPQPKLTEQTTAHGAELFRKACAGCHGSTGKGDGPVIKKFPLSTLPANLATPLYSIKIRSTLIGSPPRDEDLYRTLTRGLPGTAMWSFSALSPDDRWALVQHIKTLAPEYKSEQAPVVAIPKKVPRDSKIVDAGAPIYSNVCQACHGADGLGGSPRLRDPETGREFPGLDFANKGGLELLSGLSDDDIARTLMTGLHDRSPMRSFRAYFFSENATESEKALNERNFWGLVYYVQDLIAAQKAPVK